MPDYKPPDHNRCTHRQRNGHRCTMLLCREHPELCHFHYCRWLKEQDKRPPRLSLVGAGQLDNPQAVRRSLKHVARELVEGHMTPEQAHVLSKLGRLLLFSTRTTRKRRSRPAHKSGVGRRAVG